MVTVVLCECSIYKSAQFLIREMKKFAQALLASVQTWSRENLVKRSLDVWQVVTKL